VVGVEAVGIAVRVVLFEEMLRLGLGGKVRAVAIAKSGGRLSHYAEDEKDSREGWGGETQTAQASCTYSS
jgi:hypothetical protein